MNFLDHRSDPYLLHWLPSYATPNSNILINKETLAEGKIQKDALRFLDYLMSYCSPHHIYDAFRLMLEYYPKSAYANRKSDDIDNLAFTTMTLAALEDFGSVAPLIHHRILLIDDISRSMRKYAKGLDFNILSQFKRKGDLTAADFCAVFEVTVFNLLLKIATEDDLEAFKVFYGDSSPIARDTLWEALARTPFDAGSKIRVFLDENGCSLSQDEANHRFSNQLSFLGGDTYAPLTTSVDIKIGGSTDYHSIESWNHQLEVIPCFRELVKKAEASYLRILDWKIYELKTVNDCQHDVMKSAIEFLHSAGIKGCDILVAGIIDYTGVGKRYYESLTDEEKLLKYPTLLIEEGTAIANSDDISIRDQIKLTGMLHLMKIEPADRLESACKTPAHWHLLYRATGEKRYLSKTQGRISKILAEDLGL